MLQTGNLFILFACLAVAQQVPAVPRGFTLGDDAAGPTCPYYLGIGGFAWTRKGGDWIDEAGTLYGDKAFDTNTVVMGRGRPFTDWDVTRLVQGWLQDRYANTGLLLRVQPGVPSGVIDFHSRESADRTAHPMLKLQWSDGTQTRLPAAADTFLDCSSAYSLGAAKELKVSASQSAWLRFALPKSAVTLQKATLYLTSDIQFGNGAKIGVFRLAPPYVRAPVSPSTGLSEGFVRDAGIEKHPDVIFATSFEGIGWAGEWSEKSFRSNAETISEDEPHRFEPLVGRALRVRLVKGKNFGLDMRYNFANQGKAEPEEIYFRYYLRFGADWNPYLNGGKLPGISGTYGRAGWGMRRTDGYNGWSMRGSFAPRPAGVKSVVGLTALGSYAYHANVEAYSGDGWGWGEGPSALLENNRWYAVEQYVKLNVPGVSNGVARAWVDGFQVMEKTGILFRKTQALKIETIWMDVYHGGQEVSPENMTLYIDNVVVSRRYIGPLKQ